MSYLHSRWLSASYQVVASRPLPSRSPKRRECALPFFVDDEIFVLAKKGGMWLGDFRKVLDESPIEVDVPKKSPQVLVEGGFG